MTVTLLRVKDQAGIEPATIHLTDEGSTAELLVHMGDVRLALTKAYAKSFTDSLLI